MIKVSVEVHEGTAPFRVAVRAGSITRAINLIEGRHPGRNVRVVFPIDPEEFFVATPQETEAVRRRTTRAEGPFTLPY